MRKQWTENEIKYLTENYKKKTNREIAEYLGRTKTAVDLKANKLGLKSSEYYYNEDYFKFIDNEEKAYWLGFIAADGWVSHASYGSEFGIQLQIQDKNHLKKLNKSINGNLEIKELEKVCNLNGKIYKSCVLRIYNKKFVSNLEKWGINSKKTYDMKIPNIDDNLIRHYIRGFFDGDGYVCKSEMFADFTSANLSLLEELRSILNQNDIKSYICQDKETTYKLKIGGIINCDRFYRYMYENTNIYLDRKYNKMKKVYSELDIENKIIKYNKKNKKSE